MGTGHPRLTTTVDPKHSSPVTRSEHDRTTQDQRVRKKRLRKKRVRKNGPKKHGQTPPRGLDHRLHNRGVPVLALPSLTTNNNQPTDDKTTTITRFVSRGRTGPGSLSRTLRPCYRVGSSRSRRYSSEVSVWITRVRSVRKGTGHCCRKRSAHRTWPIWPSRSFAAGFRMSGCWFQGVRGACLPTLVHGDDALRLNATVPPDVHGDAVNCGLCLIGSRPSGGVSWYRGRSLGRGRPGRSSVSVGASSYGAPERWLA